MLSWYFLTTEDTENDIDEGGALPPEEPLEDKEIEEEHKSEKSKKAKTSPKRSRAAKKRRHDDTYGMHMLCNILVYIVNTINCNEALHHNQKGRV